MSRATPVVIRTPVMSFRVRPRAIVVCVVSLVIMLAAVAVGLSLGSYLVPLDELVGILLGRGPEAARRVVLEWRAPRVVAAAVFGAALALSGAVFQTLTRNPLGSPDIVGFSTGSLTGVLLVMLAGGSGFFALAGGAIAGGLATAVAVYLIALRRGVQGFRLIVVGIAFGSMLTSVNTWITVKSELDLALRAAVWGAGTLNGIRWNEAVPGVIAVAALIVLLVVRSPSLRQLELGDDTAGMLGVRVERSKLLLIVVAVGLMAAVTAVAGPIAFVALAAPQVARRLMRSGSAELIASAVVGAALLSVADVVALHAFPGTAIPVGAVTVCVGGLYLVWLLASETKKRW